jgi:hypothetical protein
VTAFPGITMTMPLSDSSATAPVGTAPSLSSLLGDLGHDCTGVCATAASELGAEPWFVRRRTPVAGPGLSTLVVVDASGYAGSADRSRRLVRSINECLRPDGIRVSERRIDDAGIALSKVDRSRAPIARPLNPDGPGRLTRISS